VPVILFFISAIGYGLFIIDNYNNPGGICQTTEKWAERKWEKSDSHGGAVIGTDLRQRR
jgi:hypothetical protein